MYKLLFMRKTSCKIWQVWTDYIAEFSRNGRTYRRTYILKIHQSSFNGQQNTIPKLSFCSKDVCPQHTHQFHYFQKTVLQNLLVSDFII
jgi:hypothetical protein